MSSLGLTPSAFLELVNSSPPCGTRRRNPGVLLNYPLLCPPVLKVLGLYPKHLWNQSSLTQALCCCLSPGLTTSQSSVLPTSLSLPVSSTIATLLPKEFYLHVASHCLTTRALYVVCRNGAHTWPIVNATSVLCLFASLQHAVLTISLWLHISAVLSTFL